MDGDATRGRTLLEESREAVVVLDDADRVIGASRRARQSIDGLREGGRIPEGLLSGDAGIVPLVVPYDVGGRRERLVYLSRSGDLTAYEELARSHPGGVVDLSVGSPVDPSPEVIRAALGSHFMTEVIAA